MLGRDDVHGDAAGTKRRRNLEADEARADDHDALGCWAFAIIARLSANVRRYETRPVGARDVQAHRLGAGRDQQRVESDVLPLSSWTRFCSTSRADDA